MSSYADATGQPRVIRFAGRDVAVHPVRPRDLGELDAWLRDQVPNPKAEAKKYMEGMPETVQIHIWNTAVQEAKDWPPRVDNEEGDRILTTTPEGAARMVYVTLRRGMPGLTLDQAHEMAEAATPDEFRALIRYASGVGDPDDPKSPSTAKTPEAISITPPSEPSSP